MVQSAELAATTEEGQPVVNDFQINVATINGTGSQTSNAAIMRAIFRMGIPVNGKNIFPSNIAGLPTWFTIRTSKDGYTARRDDSAILVAMNPNTAVDDAGKVPPGGICIYDDIVLTDQRYKASGFSESRDDITYIKVPVDALVSQSEVPENLRDRVRNMVYVGVLARVIDIDLEALHFALNVHFNNKERAVKPNMDIIRLSYNWAVEQGIASGPYRLEPMERTRGMIMMEGNAASALGAVFGGVTVLAWYPITPSTSLADAAKDYLAALRHDPQTGLADYAIIQAEDELAAIGMVVGAGWAGARAMTATSGPGISLMAEFSGLAYFAEVPAVIWDVQRMGPSTGLPTRVSQGDVLFAYFLGHGDSRHPVLFPANLAEAFEFGWKAFDIAEYLQTPIFVLSDLDLGMNLWTSEPFEYPSEPMNRGKVLSAQDLEGLRGQWARYKDTDGDGVGWRTLPGTEHWSAAYFTRGTGHNEKAEYSERSEDWENNLRRLEAKFDTARSVVPQPVLDVRSGASVGIISFGTNDAAVKEAQDLLCAQGIETSYLRVRALPLQQSVHDFIQAHNRVYVVENNFEGQLASILRMDYPDVATRLNNLAKCDGLPLTARWIAESIVRGERS